MKNGIFGYLSILIVLLSLENLIISSHKCGTDLLKKEKKVFVKQLVTTKKDKWAPIRIHLDYSYIDKNKEKFSADHVEYLKEKVMPNVKNIFESLLKVRPISNKLVFANNPCGKMDEIPWQYWTMAGVTADLVIFVMMDESYEEKGVEAAALHCFQDDETNRPLAGHITFSIK